MNFTHNTVLTNTTVTQPKNTELPSKTTGLAPFTEKPLRALKNSSGLENEINFSRQFHSVGIPLLVSPTLLRLRNLGQIDLARLKKDGGDWVVEIGEVKSSIVGAEQMEKSQKRRLFYSQHFLAGLFGHRTKLVRMLKKD